MSIRALLLALLAGAACSTASDQRLEDLEGARARWASHAIPIYTFTLRRTCFCGGPFRVEVRVDEVAVIRTDLDTGQPVPAAAAAWFPDVPGLFRVIEDELRRPAASLAVQYDPVTGVPLSITVDPIANAIDDEYGYVVSDFRRGR